MAFRNVLIPWLGGGLVVLGYAALQWRRDKRLLHGSVAPSVAPPPEVEPLTASLEHVPEALALDLESEPLPANNNAQLRRAELGALFLGRASDALSPFQFGPHWPSQPR